MRINIHSHLILQDTLGKAGKYGPSVEDEEDGSVSLVVGPYRTKYKAGNRFIEDPRFTDPKARLLDMDDKNIDAMGLTITPLFYLYWADREIGAEFSRVQNDAMSRFCSEDPSRLFFFATLPLQDIEASVVEVDRAVGELGAKGVNIGQTDVALQRFPDDEWFFPLYEKIEALGVPLFIHPYPPGMDGNGLRELKDEFNLSWMAGYVHQASISGLSMMLGGVFDTFPKLQVILSHGGGYLPYQWGRFVFASTRVPGVKCKRPLEEYVAQNLYFDCLVHDPRGRRLLIDFASADRVLVGDNYLGWDAVNGFELVEELGLEKQDEDKIMGDNAQRLFRL